MLCCCNKWPQNFSDLLNLYNQRVEWWLLGTMEGVGTEEMLVKGCQISLRRNHLLYNLGTKVSNNVYLKIDKILSDLTTKKISM
jgi:hypothetical protein